MAQVSKKQFASGVFWKFTEALCTKGISLVVTIILARILSPEQNGIVALTTVLISFSDIFIYGGFNTALIRKKSAESADYSSVLFISLSFSILLYAILYFAAPAIATFYQKPLLKPVIRAIAIVLLPQAVTVVYNAKLIREMRFKLIFRCTFISNLVAGVVGIAAALSGFGVWALVAQQVVYNIIYAIMHILVCRWRFKLAFSLSAIKEMFSFSRFVLVSSILDFAGNNLISLFVGKTYSTETLAYYSKGALIPEQICLYTFNSIQSALLPTFSSMRDDIKKMKDVVRRIVCLTAYLVFPIMLGLLAVSKNLIIVLLTEKWLPSAPIMMCMCVSYGANPIRSICVQVMYAMGRSGMNMKQECLRIFLMLTGMVLVLYVARASIEYLALTHAIIAVIYAVIKLVYMKSLISYTVFEWLSDLFPPLLMSIVMLGSIFAAGTISISVPLSLTVQILVGVLVYGALSIAIRPMGYKEVVTAINCVIAKMRVKK